MYGCNLLMSDHRSCQITEHVDAHVVRNKNKALRNLLTVTDPIKTQQDGGKNLLLWHQLPDSSQS